MKTKKEYTKIVNIMSPGVEVLVQGRGKMYYFFKNCLFSGA